MRFAGVSLQSAVDMASRHPAKILGLDVCEFGAGDGADFILLTEPTDGSHERIRGYHFPRFARATELAAKPRSAGKPNSLN